MESVEWVSFVLIIFKVVSLAAFGGVDTGNLFQLVLIQQNGKFLFKLSNCFSQGTIQTRTDTSQGYSTRCLCLCLRNTLKVSSILIGSRFTTDLHYSLLFPLGRSYKILTRTSVPLWLWLCYDIIQFFPFWGWRYIIYEILTSPSVCKMNASGATPETHNLLD